MWRYDPAADAATLELSSAPVASTRELADDWLLDLDADGRVVRIEVLFASDQLPEAALTGA